MLTIIILRSVHYAQRSKQTLSQYLHTKCVSTVRLTDVTLLLFLLFDGYCHCVAAFALDSNFKIN